MLSLPGNVGSQDVKDVQVRTNEIDQSSKCAPFKQLSKSTIEFFFLVMKKIFELVSLSLAVFGYVATLHSMSRMFF